jgi:hypothetical protein
MVLLVKLTDGLDSGSKTGSTASTLKFAYQLVKHQISAGVIVKHGAVNSAIKCLGEDGELCFGESDGDHGRLR